MEWILCFLFAICPSQAQIPSNISPLAQLLIEGQQTLGDGWHVIGVTDESYQQVINFSDCCAAISLTEVQFANPEWEADYFSYDEDMQPYFSLILSGYAPFELYNNCEQGNLTIYEFRGEFNNQPFVNRLYFEHNGSEVRVVGLHFPLSTAPKIDEYAARFYPEMVKCPNEPMAINPKTAQDTK